MILPKLIAMGVSKRIKGPFVDKDEEHSYMNSPGENRKYDDDMEKLYNSPYFDKLVMLNEELAYCLKEGDPEKCAKLSFKIYKLQKKICDKLESMSEYESEEY